jgi:type 1 glutamine amidotransferase
VYSDAPVLKSAGAFFQERFLSRRALIVYGGWEGHSPREVAALFEGMLREAGFQVEVSDSLESLADEKHLRSLSLIVPHWTMGKIQPQHLKAVLAAVESGVGLAGCHGGMCDAFREATDWHFMTGGQWVAHPGNDGTGYVVKVVDGAHPIMQGVKDFEVESEQYYMHVDPAVKLLATTRFPVADGPHVSNGPVEMPVVWTKMFGRGKVFYNSLGHTRGVLEREPVSTIMRRGFLWSARS